jgi:hypothetical protein
MLRIRFLEFILFVYKVLECSIVWVRFSSVIKVFFLFRILENITRVPGFKVSIFLHSVHPFRYLLRSPLHSTFGLLGLGKLVMEELRVGKVQLKQFEELKQLAEPEQVVLGVQAQKKNWLMLEKI